MLRYWTDYQTLSAPSIFNRTAVTKKKRKKKVTRERQLGKDDSTDVGALSVLQSLIVKLVRSVRYANFQGIQSFLAYHLWGQNV